MTKLRTVRIETQLYNHHATKRSHSVSVLDKKEIFTAK